MARSYNGTTAYLICSSAPVTAAPFTMSCWFNAANVTATLVLMSLGVNTGSTHRFALSAAGATAGDPVTTDVVGSANATASTTTSYSANVWNHACGVHASSSSRSVYLNGGGVGTNTTSSTTTGINRTLIGARLNSGSVGLFWNGKVAFPCIHSAALTAEEIASLFAGKNPMLVRPDSNPFFLSPYNDRADIRGGLLMTDNGPTTAADDPPFYW